MSSSGGAQRGLFDSLTPDPAEAEELARQVAHHDQRYWQDQAPEIPDAEYDGLVERLRRLAPDHPVLQRVGGGGGAADGGTHRHAVPMLSLDKCYDPSGLQRWLAKVSGLVVESPKLDGVAAALVYDDSGTLRVGATRGSGAEGEVITAQLKGVTGVPARIAEGPLEVRGEVYLPLSRFAEIQERFANPRNTAAGALKQKDPRATAGYGLRFCAYALVEPGHEREQDRLRRLHDLGFDVVEHRVLSPDEVPAAYSLWLQRQPALDFEIDGVVYEVDSVAAQQEMGHTAHHPRSAIAYKLPTEASTARLLDVEWSVSRTGTLTPVAIIEPTLLSGATVTRVSLHNAGMLAKLGVTRTASVRVVRRGGVIPKVEAVVEATGAPLELPALCPACEGPVALDGDFLACPNRAGCPAQRQGALEHYLKALGVDGFGPAILEQIVAHGLAAQPADLYRLRPEHLVPLEHMGRTLAVKLVENLDRARTPSLPAFLTALGIPDLGPAVAGVLGERFGALAALREASAEDLAALPGIGPTIAEHVVSGLRSLEPQIEALLEQVQVVATPSVAPSAAPWAGSSFVFTGKMEHMKRAEAQARVRALGGTTPAAVVRDLTYLVVGDRGSPLLGQGRRGGKLRRAEQLQSEGASVEIISETRVLELLAAV